MCLIETVLSPGEESMAKRLRRFWL